MSSSVSPSITYVIEHVEYIWSWRNNFVCKFIDYGRSIINPLPFSPNLTIMGVSRLNVTKSTVHS